jgi:WD40 repeat protein
VSRTLRFPDRVWWVAVSSDGKELAVQMQAQDASSSTVEVQDIASGDVLYRHRVPNGNGGVEFSPDGRELAALGCCQPDSTIEVWDARSGGLLFRPHLDGHVNSITFSPDGRLLAGGTEDGKVILWNGQTGKLVDAPLQVATFGVNPISFSPDGRMFAASSGDQTATLWDVQSRKRVGGPFPIEQGSVPVARFAADGRLVVENVADTSQWPVDVRTWERFACQVVGRDLTRAEWHDVLPNRTYRHVCPQ